MHTKSIVRWPSDSTIAILNRNTPLPEIMMQTSLDRQNPDDPNCCCDTDIRHWFIFLQINSLRDTSRLELKLKGLQV